MDLKGSLVNTNLKIVPSISLTKYLNTLKLGKDAPQNIHNIIKGKPCSTDYEQKEITIILDQHDIEIIKKVKDNLLTNDHSNESEDINKSGVKNEKGDGDSAKKTKKLNEAKKEQNDGKDEKAQNSAEEKKTYNYDKMTSGKSKEKQLSEMDKPSDQYQLFLVTSDIDWLYTHLQSLRTADKTVPYLHTLLEDCTIVMPQNKVLKRNPDLEARCVKLRAQQEAREYRKMTKGVDNVRMRFPEDSISYQLKSMNRQLIAVGQFIISIFAGFMFGFRGVEWMVGNLEFGFRLLLGVMCALIIALAEIYFLAKKLNEELNIPETVQLGGPPKFASDVDKQTEIKQKPHQD